MMKYIRMLFPGIVMQTQEGANMIITFLLRNEFFRGKLGDNPYMNEGNRFKTAAKVLTLVGRLVAEFLKRLGFVLVAIILPWLVISAFCPLIYGQRELFVMYCFFVLCTVCGTFTNTRLFTMSDRDVFLVDKAAVDQARFYFGKVVYRMAMDLVFDFLSLMIVGVGAGHAFMLSLVTALARPVGEMIVIVAYAISRKTCSGKSAYDGVIIALSILAAYVVPYANRRMNVVWYGVSSPVAAAVVGVLALLGLYVLWNYKRYGYISRDMIMMRRED
jgi:hypothetical protein